MRLPSLLHSVHYITRTERFDGKDGKEDTTQPMQPLRILIADGHALFSQSLGMVLRKEPDVGLVGEARSVTEAIREAKRIRPDVILIDADLPGSNVANSVSMITEHLEDSRVLVLSGLESLSVLASAMDAGATGFLTKEAPLIELIDAVRATHRGETRIPPQMLGPLLRSLMRRRRNDDETYRLISGLTRREREVLVLLSEGADNDTIGSQLGISPQTARTHIQNILSKLKVHSRLEAATLVIQNGVLEQLANA